MSVPLWTLSINWLMAEIPPSFLIQGQLFSIVTPWMHVSPSLQILAAGRKFSLLPSPLIWNSLALWLSLSHSRFTSQETSPGFHPNLQKTHALCELSHPPTPIRCYTGGPSFLRASPQEGKGEQHDPTHYPRDAL